jgi:hydrogenase maturation protease
MTGAWEELERPGPDWVEVRGRQLRAGSTVRLRPLRSADMFDLALAGRTAVIEAIEEDMDGRISLAVVVEDDPGRDLGLARQPGHRFFFLPSEVEPVENASPGQEARTPKLLIAGIGNVFLGDDGFGVALADRLTRHTLPAGVEVRDFGIRGMDLAYAMHDGYDAVVLLDAVPRGNSPGTLYVIEPEIDEGDKAIDTHGMDPMKVLALAQALGGPLPRTLVVGCEPQTRISDDETEVVMQLSEAVRAALQPAVELVASLLAELNETHRQEVTEQ